jgi:hypothetical protein
MHKSELMAMLDHIEDNYRVLIATDEEGNDFNEIYEVSIENDQDSELYEQWGAPLIVLWP